MPDYPECEMMELVREERMIIFAFMEYLRSRGVVLSRWHQEHPDVDAYLTPESKNLDELTAHYFGYDLKKVEAERRQMLEVIRNGANSDSASVTLAE